MNWIFWTFPIAGGLHVVEEFFLPGGFLQMAARLNPRYAPRMTPLRAALVNAAFLLLCVLGALCARGAPVGEANRVFSLSIAGLVLINGILHIGVALRLRRYAPGLLTGALLYLPLSLYAYSAAAASGWLTGATAALTLALGALYQLAPIAAVLAAGPKGKPAAPLAWRLMKIGQYVHRGMYAIGLGPLIGRIVLLLTTTGRISGKRRVTPLQYEEIDGILYVAAARGRQADWYRNLLADPRVQVQIKSRRFAGLAQPVNDPARVADFLATRLQRHPRMVGAMMKLHHLPPNPSRAQLEALAAGLALVALREQPTGE